MECRVARATVESECCGESPQRTEFTTVRHADQLTVGRQVVLQIGVEAVEVLGTQCVDIRTAVGEPVDLVLAVIVKSHQDPDEMVASPFCLVKVSVACCTD